MATSRLVNGVMREFWQRDDAQAPGPPDPGAVVTTGIRISAGQLSRVQGILCVTNTAGTPSFTAALSISANRRLVVTVTNGGGGTGTWTLDVALVQSQDQGRRAGAGYISIANATAGLLALETLAQAYVVGAVEADQTMVIADADGGGVRVDGSGEVQVVTALGSVSTFEVRCNHDDIFVPIKFRRPGDFANPAQLVFEKSRGTFAVPGNIAQNDLLGCIDFYGRIAGAQVLGAQIIADATAVGASLDAQLEFYASVASAVSLTVSMGVLALNQPITTFYQLNHAVVPNVDAQGHLGNAAPLARSWGEIAGYDVNVMANVKMNAVPNTGVASYTIIFTNASVMPAGPVAAQVYVGSEDFSGPLGTGAAVVSVMAEEPAIAIGQTVADTLIPLRYNGANYWVLAYHDIPA